MAKPLIFDLDGNIGMLSDARVCEAAAFVGVAWKALALRAGYRALFVDEVSLSSPMIGLGLWL